MIRINFCVSHLFKSSLPLSPPSFPLTHSQAHLHTRIHVRVHTEREGKRKGGGDDDDGDDTLLLKDKVLSTGQGRERQRQTDRQRVKRTLINTYSTSRAYVQGKNGASFDALFTTAHGLSE